MRMRWGFLFSLISLIGVFIPASSLMAGEIKIDALSLGSDLTVQLENMQSGESTVDVRLSPYCHPADSSHIYWMLQGISDNASTLENAAGTYSARAIDLFSDLSFRVMDLNMGGTFYYVDFLNFPNSYDTTNHFWMLGDMRVIENLPTIQSVKSPLALNGKQVTVNVSETAIVLTGSSGALMDVDTKETGVCTGIHLRAETTNGSWDLPLQSDCSFQGTVYGNPGNSLQLVLTHSAGQSLLGQLPIPASGTVTAGALYRQRYDFKAVTGLTPGRDYHLCEVQESQSGCIAESETANCIALTSDANGDLRMLLEKGKHYQLIIDSSASTGCKTFSPLSNSQAYILDQRIEYSENAIEQTVENQWSGTNSPTVEDSISSEAKSVDMNVGPETGDGITLSINRLHFFAYTANTLSQFQTCWWDWPFSVYTWHGLKSRAVADIPLPGSEWMDSTAHITPWTSVEADAMVALVCDPLVTNCYAPGEAPCSCKIDQNTVRFSPESALDAYTISFKKGDAVAFLPNGGALFYEVYDMKYSLDPKLAALHLHGDMTCKLSADHWADYGDEGPEGYEQQWAFEAFNQSASGVAYFFQFPLLDYAFKITISGGEDELGKYIEGGTGPYDYYFRYDLSLYVPEAS